MPGCIFDKQIRRKLSQKAEEFNSKQLNQNSKLTATEKAANYFHLAAAHTQILFQP